MSEELSNIERMVDEWERDAAKKAARYENLRQEVERISITESAADGAVSVTIGHNGIPSDVRMTQAVSRMRPEEIAAAVMQAMTRAQSRYPAELARLMGETVGDDTTTRHLLAEAERNFPQVELESPPPPSNRQFGYEADDEQQPPASPPRPTPQRRPRPDNGPDGDDFSDQSILR